MKGKRLGVAVALGLWRAAFAPGLRAGEDPRPPVDVVFVLDTTGSMGGLLEAAKQKTWSIAAEIAKGSPKPRLRMGLVAYRDRGDAYVTKTFDLADNLDVIYKELSALRPEGGGDGPEHVLKGLQAAIERLSWEDDKNAFKVLYLVGDAPPHEEYGDTPGLAALMARAAGKGIVVNAVQCGTDPATTAAWRRAARLGGGSFLALPQDGGARAIASPWDDRLSELSRKLDATALGYGSRRRELASAKRLSADVASMAPASAAAERGAFLAASGGYGAGLDLLKAVEDKRVDVADLKDADLPEELRALTPAQRGAELDRRVRERRALQAELEALAARRERFLADERRKGGRADAFDTTLLQSLKGQAARKGIRY